MTLPRIILVLLLSAGLAACASTETRGTASSGDAETATTEVKKPKKRCYREKTTGSRLGERVCVKAK